MPLLADTQISIRAANRIEAIKRCYISAVGKGIGEVWNGRPRA